MGTIDLAKRVVANCQHEDGLDLQTASAILAVADKLNDANRAKLDTMSVAQAASVAWKLVK